MTVALAQRFCVNHPERVVHALCMSCRRPICHECATAWEGVNHCAQCLPQRRGRARGERRVLPWLTLATITLLLAFLNVRALVWIGAYLAGLRE
jgi:hypothetical protein